MKTLIFSDTHLSHKFDRKRFDILLDLINSVDQVIINGDFWDNYLTTWDKFLNSEWNQLFPLLKQKKTIYIFGNHDKEDWMDHRKSLFSDTTDYKTVVTAGSLKLLIQHGDLIAPSIEEMHPFVLLHERVVKATIRIYDSFASIFGSLYFKLGVLRNIQMRNWAIKNLKENQILVCGHTHLLEYNLNSKFVNTGLIRFGILQYLIVEDESLNLIDRRY